METWRVWVKIASQSSLHATRHPLRCATFTVSHTIPQPCWCTLNILQHSRVNTHNGGYRSVRGVKGRDGEGEQGVKGKEFHCRGRQAALMAKSGMPDLGFGWEPTPTTTLASMGPRQAGREVGVGGLLGRAPLAML
jgi:hypothetical protein